MVKLVKILLFQFPNFFDNFVSSDLIFYIVPFIDSAA